MSDEELPEDEAEGEDLVDEAGADALVWFKAFRRLVNEQMPHVGASRKAMGHEEIEVPARVARSRDLCLIAAYDAMAVMARKFDTPPEMPTLILDVSRIGKDG